MTEEKVQGTTEEKACPEGCACESKLEESEIRKEMPEELSQQFLKGFVEQTHRFLTNTRLQSDALIGLLLERGLITSEEMDRHLELAIDRYNQALMQQEGMATPHGQDPEHKEIDEECGITIVIPDEEEEAKDE